MLVRYVCYKVWVTARVQLKNDQHLYPINADPHRHIRTTIQSIIKFISCIFPEFLDFHPQVLWELWLFQSGPLQISHDVGIHRLNPRLRNPHQGQLWWRRQPGSRNGRTWKSQGQCVSLNLILNAMLNALLSQWNIMFLGNVYAYCNMIYLNFQISTKAI